VKTKSKFLIVGIQSYPDPLAIENQRLKDEVSMLKAKLEKHRWNADKISGSDATTKFYTGLPSFSVFMWLYQLLAPKTSRMTYWTGESSTSTVNKSRCSNAQYLRPIDQLLAVLMRNKLGLFVQDVADRFGISPSTFSKYYTTCICLLHQELKKLNPFPSRDIIDRTMPSQFKLKYPSTRIIIDCTEIFIQRSSSLTNQSLTYSSYKNHNTIKFLIGITPAGAILFVSEAWGGRVSDRQLTQESGLLELLEEGDSVMADKEFTISDLLKTKGCTLNIPPFRGNSNQFTTEEVHQTQEIASLRIHVERKIGRVKNFHIFDGILPLSLAPLATKLFQVCCWLTNLEPPLVEDK